MKKTFLMAALAALGATAVGAADYKIERILQTDASPAQVWNLIGDFCDIDDWHPAITGCKLRSIDGAVHRILTVGDAEIVEKLIASEAGLSYTYTIETSPFPIEKYTATLSVEALNGSRIAWSGRFSSDDASMEEFFAGVFEAGLANIESALSGQ